jgi:methionine synthase II (cobalamin-independent)
MSVSTFTHAHADVVGSLLRPPGLADARARFRTGKMSAADFAAVENQAVDEALQLQEHAGLPVLTDGELRRDIFFGFFVSGMSGLSHLPGSTVRFHSHEQKVAMEVQIPFTVTEKVTARECPGVAEFNYAKTKTERLIKVTLPSPMMILGFWNEKSREAYPNPFDLATDTAEVVATWMKQLAAAGCRYIQIDAPELNEAYADEKVRAEHLSRGIDPGEFIQLGTELVGSLGELDLPGVRKALHVCKGNGTQSWIAEGGYEDFSRAVFERARGFDTFHLEYDDERSGSFDPLRHLRDDRFAILGLISTKWTRLESVEELNARIRDAARFHPLEQLGLATQCGFASAGETAADRRITDEVQRAKLARVVEASRAVWG